jgi:O-antigen/teichoic acid export membrane protein
VPRNIRAPTNVSTGRFARPRGTSAAQDDTAEVVRDAVDLSTERMARGTRDNLAGAVVERVLGLALTLMLPAFLPPAALGGYYELTALLTILLIVSVFGLDTGVTRFTALMVERGRPDLIRAYARSALTFSAILATCLACGVALTAPLLAHAFRLPALTTAFRTAAFFLPAMTAAYILVAASKGLKRMGPWVLVIQVIQPTVVLALTVALIAGGLGLPGAGLALTASAGAAAAVALRSFRGRFELPTADPGRLLGQLVRFAAPAAGMTLMGTSLLWIDTMLLGLYRPPAEVAAYGLAVRLMLISAGILFAVTQIFGPFVTQLLERGQMAGLENTLRTATRWVVLLAGPVLALIAILGTRILDELGQRGSLARAGILTLCAAFLIDSTTGPVGHVLTMAGRPGINFANNAVGLAANVTLNILLIPRLGIEGAAIAWATVIVGINVARVLEVRQLFGITPFSWTLLKPVGATVLGASACGAVLALMGHLATYPIERLLASALAFILTYLASTWLFGIEADDRTLVRALVRSTSSRRARRAVEVPIGGWPR